jgi:hypothetical protein
MAGFNPPFLMARGRALLLAARQIFQYTTARTFCQANFAKKIHKF